MTLSIVALIVSGVMLIISILTFAFARHKESKESIKEEDENLSTMREGILRIDLKLDAITKTASETSNEVKLINAKIAEHDRQLAKIEAMMEIRRDGGAA